MSELILSEITRMGPGFCIIGLEAASIGYRSIRPLPRYGWAWPASLPHRRGWRVQCQLVSVSVPPPHVEDRTSSGTLRKLGELAEEGLVCCLRQAEVADHIRDLFGCLLENNRSGRGFFAEPNEASRSICGAELQNLRFLRQDEEIRAELLLRDGGRLRLPLVDAVWKEFLEQTLNQITGANKEQRANKFLSSSLPRRLLDHPALFARIGLTRPFMGKCWLMLDSLFPQPRVEWLEELS
jgi:hypothetical protein